MISSAEAVGYHEGHAGPPEGNVTQLEIEILHTPDCPHWRSVHRRIEELARDEGIAVVVAETTIADPLDAEVRRFPGSPTILIGGRDIEPRPAGAPADYGLG